MRKKKLLAALISAAMTLGSMTGCGNAESGVTASNSNDVKEAQTQETSTNEVASDTEAETEDKSLKIVTTIFPEYDWVKTVLGDKVSNAELTLLLDNGVDLHSYQPTAEDIVKIQECDMFVYVGGESDEWVEDVLASAENPDMSVINLLDVLGDSVKAEEIVEGMEHEHDHDHEESEAHKKEVSTFEDNEVQNRQLSDWAGEWQSAYPFVLDGTLDEGFEHKAESGTMTAKEYKEYYKKGYESDIANIVIDGDNNTIEYTYTDGRTCKSTYKYTGYYIQNWSTGTKAAMYRFEAEDKESGAPIYIEFNDHIIEPCAAEHFHFRSSNTSYDDIVDPENSWPTFFPASFDGDDMLDAFIGHDHKDEDEDEHDHEDADEHEDDHEDADSDEHEHEEGEEHEHEEEMDEHVWLSLRNAEVLCDSIADELGKIDPANADTYKKNAQAYNEELAALDKEYEAAVAAADKKTLLFGDRFPFRYLVDDYGLDYYAAFTGCSAESEASFETIIFLAEKVNELKLGAIMTIEGPNHDIAETVKNATESKDQKILTLNSMQSTTSHDIKAGVTYLSVMEKNLEVLKEALQ